MNPQLTREMFTYLATLARMNVRQVRALEEWMVEGTSRPVTFIADAPAHPAVRTVMAGTTVPGVVLSVTKPAIPAPPPPDADWVRWAEDAGVSFDPASMDPAPRPSDTADEWELDRRAEEAAVRYEHTLEGWRQAYRTARAVEALYSRLWEQRQIVAADPERFEVVVGVGLITWNPDGTAIRRPAVTMPARIEFDGDNSRVDIEVDESELRIETDLFPPVNSPSREAPGVLAERLGELDTVFAPDEVGPAFTEYVGSFAGSGGRGSWDPEAGQPIDIPADPRISYSPLVAVRPRSTQARVDLLEALADVDQLSDAMLSLVEITNAQLAPLPRGEEIEQRFHPELLLPQPSSPAQRQMALSMERNPLTVVFGPPGTGKTYTIANLLGHLLAQGKRVLVTAEKEEALHEVRDKVIPGLTDLVVPVLKASSQDRKLLAHSVQRISARRNDKSIDDRRSDVERLTTLMHELQGERTRLVNQLIEAWEAERDIRFESGRYQGTVEDAADALMADAEMYGWFNDTADQPLGLLPGDLAAIADLEDRAVWEAGAITAPIIADNVAMPAQVAAGEAHGLKLTTAQTQRLVAGSSRRAAVTAPSSAELADQLAEAAVGAAGLLEGLLDGSNPWMSRLVEDARQGHLDLWTAQATRTSESAATISSSLESLAGASISTPAGSDEGALKAAATTITEEVEPGRRLRGWLQSKPVKEAAAILTGVTVNGSVVDTHEEAALLIRWCDAATAHKRLVADWAPHVERVNDLDPEQALPLAWRLAEMTREAVATIEKATETLTPLREAGVELADPWSPAELRADAVGLQWAAAARRLAERVSRLTRYRDQLPQDLHRRHELAEALTVLAERHDPAPWTQLAAEMDRLRALQRRATAGAAALDRLAATAPLFAQTLDDDVGGFFARLPDVEAAWQWRHASEQFRRLASRKGILETLEQSEARLTETRKALVEEKAWLGVQERLAAQPELTQALRDYSAAQQRVPKTRTAKSYLPNLRAAQKALTRCSDAVPVWVMAIDEVAEMFAGRATGSEPAFDVVIVDEASQSPLTSSFVMQLASSVAIVGDPFQTSPPSFRAFAALTAARAAIGDGVVRARLDPTESLWNIGATVVDRISLTEHFRCPPEVIGWAQEKIYRDLADVDLEVLTGTDPHRPKPIIAHHVADGYGERTNPNEAAALVADLRALLESPPGWLRTVGVVARTPEQAGIIQRLVFDSIDETALESVDLRVGTPYQFQGAQRDVIYLSMVSGPPDDGRMHVLRTFETITVNQMNVAVSRAKQQLRVFYSCPPGGYKPEDVRRSFLEHAITADRDWELRQAPGVPLEVSEDELTEPFDSLSEQRLFNRLVRRGFAVTPQVEAPVGSGRYRLDFVIDGPVGSVAVEYDGPHHDTPAQYLYDRERTHDLARCGWTVLRVHHTDFNVDRDATAEALAGELRSLGVIPIGEWPQPSDEPEPAPLEEPGEPERELITAAIEATRSITDDFDDDLPRWEPVDEEEEVEVRLPIMPMVPVAAAPAPAAFPQASAPGEMVEYQQFDGPVADPLTATKPELIDGLVRVVATEGPILGDRLIQVYNRAAGNRRAGRNIRSALNSALTSAERQGRLVADNPLQQLGNKDKTYRLADQPHVIERTAGPRTLEEIPPLELLARLEKAAEQSTDRETIYRAVLADYGFKRLTPGVTEILDRVWVLRG